MNPAQNNDVQTPLYLYETHLHTAEGSLCSRISAADQVKHYHALGFTGVCITDHFFSNGSCPIPADLPWEERVNRYYHPYELAKKAGEPLGMDILFGIEHSFHGNDFLVWGLEKEWMIAHPDFHKLPLLDFLRLVRGAGAIVVHAHPYRRASYIDLIRLVPDDVDGVEIFNASRSDFDNKLACVYQEAYGLAPCAGTDNHRGAMPRYGAIASPRRFTDAMDMARAIVAREVHIQCIEGKEV